jgi:hypothetical protein
MIADSIVQKLLSERCLDHGHELAADLIARKTAMQGVRLSVRERKRILPWVKGGCVGELSLRSRRKKNIKLEITPRELRRMLGRLRKQMPFDAQAAVTAVLGRAPPLLYTQFKKNWPAHALRERRQLRAFERRLIKSWARPLRLIEMLVALSREIGGDVNEDARAKMTRKNADFVEVITRLHGRACQIASEGIVLLRSGYPDGAMARWRTLHEVAVVLLFLDTHGIKIARQYLDHQAIESFKAATDYDKYAPRLGHAPLSPEDWKRLNEERDLVLKFYGKNFSGDYGWAASVLKTPKPTFRDIENSITLAHWRPDYRLASHNVHANPKGITLRLGIDNEDVVLVGPSNIGLCEPGQNLAISLCQATAVVVQLSPTLDRLCTMKAISDLTEDVTRAFAESGPNVEPLP